KNNISHDELDKFLEYQKFRFSKVYHFIPTPSTLFNQKSINMYLFARDNLDKILYANKKAAVSKKMVSIGNKTIMKNMISSKVKDDRKKMDDKNRKRYYDTNGMKDIFIFCISNDIEFDKRSKYCKKCKSKNKCQERNL